MDVLDLGTAQINSVNVMTSDEGGLSDEQIVDLVLDKIILVSDNAPPAIKDQALVFRDNIRNILYSYVQFTKKQERATITQTLLRAGHEDLANIIRRL
tara:strand:- start:75 stop:368 length:294 start_codon:yes stop_codon:yes gene_type:complete